MFHKETIAVLSLLCAAAATADPGVDSPYVTDPQHSRVEDATSRGIGQVNMITCIMAAMKPQALVNEGDYIALVDESKCDYEGRADTANSGGGSGQAASFMTATVNSSRASNDDPMIVKTWIDEVEEGRQATIFVRTSISAAPDASNPYGEFRLDFCGAPAGGACMFSGFLEGGAGSLSFFQVEDGGPDYSGSTALKLSSVGTSTGSGELRMTRIEQGATHEEQFRFAYDAEHFLRGEQCFSRDASDPQTGMSVWRYGLYDAETGARIERQSGFPIEFEANGRTYHGHLGYWGLSLPPEAADALANGAAIQRVEYDVAGGEPTRTSFNVVKSAGRLMKYTKNSRTLRELDKIRFNVWMGDVAGLFDGATPNTQYVMYWDDAAALVKIVGRMSCGDSGCQVQDFAQEQSAPLTYWSSNGGLFGWSEALGGELFIDLHAVSGTIDSNLVQVVYRTQDVVYPSQLPATLHCLRDCPSAASIAAYFSAGSSAASPFEAASFNNWQPSMSAFVYSTDADAAMLLDASSAAVAFTDRDALQMHPEYRWGVRSGRLFTDLAAAECEPGSGTYCEFKVNTLDVYYVWETGPNPWNQFAGVKDAAGEFVAFDAPLQVNFAVPEDSARYGAYAGKQIVLQYGGFGDLWGIPGSCVSHLTNEPVSCDQSQARYVPEFVIPYDVLIGRVTTSDATYLVKWLEREIRFAPKDPSECASLALPSTVALPTAQDVVDPSDPDSSVYIGAKPTVTSAPRVVHGEVKY